MKKRICLLLTLLLVLGLTACGNGTDQSVMKEQTAAVIDALLAKDFDRCEALLSDELAEDEMQTKLSELASHLEGVESYTLHFQSYNAKTADGVTQTTCVYRMETNLGNLLVQSITVSSDPTGLASFRLSDFESTEQSSSLLGQSPLQWVFLAVAAATLGFMVWAFVDCCRKTVEQKWLWLLLIALGCICLTLTMGNGRFNGNLNYGLIVSHTALYMDGAGNFTARLLVPAGAIVYTAQRKKLHRKSQQPPVET